MLQPDPTQQRLPEAEEYPACAYPMCGSCRRQNTLILGNRNMVYWFAHRYRNSWKGLRLEDLIGAGMVGLVDAARTWKRRAKFSAWAWICIRREVFALGAKWQPFVRLKLGSGDPDEPGLHEWEVWLGRPNCPAWNALPATADEIHAGYAKVAASPFLAEAMKQLTKRERRMVKAHFAPQRGPKKSFTRLARQHCRSYWWATSVVYKAVKKLQVACRELDQGVA
jgi:RNA polymerase sigma factor (sigma-70 family)